METGGRLAVGSLGDFAGIPTSILHATVIYTLVGSATAFQCFNRALNFAPIPAKSSESRDNRIRWRNLLTSFVHALISGLFSSYCLYSSPEILEDIKHTVTPLSEVLVALSVGYFFHDLVEILATRQLASSWPLVLHHVVIIFYFGISLCLRSYVGYSLVSLVAETNSVFLHLRQILLVMDIPKRSALYRVNGAFNMATFLVFRFGTLFWMFYWLQEHRYEVPTILYVIANIGLVVMVVIDLELFKRLLISDYLSSPGDKLKRDSKILEK